MSDRVLVIVPTYNEVENLERILDRLHASVPTAHALVVDDGSPDGTGELAEKLAAARRRACTCCTGPAKAGLGPGLRRRASAGPASAATTSSSRWTPTARTRPSSCRGCWRRWATPTWCSAPGTCPGAGRRLAGAPAAALARRQPLHPLGAAAAAQRRDRRLPRGPRRADRLGCPSTTSPARATASRSTGPGGRSGPGARVTEVPITFTERAVRQEQDERLDR